MWDLASFGNGNGLLMNSWRLTKLPLLLVFPSRGRVEQEMWVCCQLAHLDNYIPCSWSCVADHNALLSSLTAHTDGSLLAPRLAAKLQTLTLICLIVACSYFFFSSSVFVLQWFFFFFWVIARLFCRCLFPLNKRQHCHFAAEAANIDLLLSPLLCRGCTGISQQVCFFIFPHVPRS